MIWVTWRQHRLQILAGAVLLGVIAIFFLFTGSEMSSAFKSSGLPSCLATHAAGCDRISNDFNDRYRSYRFLIPLFLVLPALVGVFWGAPLVAREIEHGTHRLAWTQGVTRRRWIGTKIAFLTLATAAWAGVFSFLLSWWSRPLVAVSDNRMDPGVFDLRGIVPVAYTLFALAVGIAAGTILRRTVPAMAATFAAFAGVRASIALLARPSYVAAKTISYPFPFDNGGPILGHGAWMISSTTLDGAGRFMGNGIVINFNMVSDRCPGLAPSKGSFPSPDAIQACMQRVGLHVQTLYQPGSRYWLFQGIETTIFLALSAGLVLLSVWWVKRRVH